MLSRRARRHAAWVSRRRASNLVWTKRLFGVRGGKQAYEARLRTESVMEQTALAAAPPAAAAPAAAAPAAAAPAAATPSAKVPYTP